MKKVKLATLLLGAALFTGIGATSLLAESGKCGAGKCGSSTPAKCGGEKKSMKCGAGKCGGKGKSSSSSSVKGKCGAGKCG